MKTLIVLFGGLTAVLGVPASAAAQDRELRDDLQCFLATSQLQASPDPQVQTVGIMGAMFFAGKIFGASPDIDLEAALEDLAQELSEDSLQSSRVRCSKEMERRGNQLQAAGRRLTAKGR